MSSERGRVAVALALDMTDFEQALRRCVAVLNDLVAFGAPIVARQRQGQMHRAYRAKTRRRNRRR